ncbi:MAG: hypothetical protein ACI83B_000963 [Sediminicola sp.]|jgi:hypothetical protein|tara:strand:- start:693 stop:1268 length:576 start_codon:yes stop_codon:yes gene_type:complete
MTAKYLMLICFFVVSITGFCQNNDNSIESQFVNVVDKSNNYQEFKVIKKNKINDLRKNVIDSIEALEAKITIGKTEIEKQKSEIQVLTQNLNATKSNLAASIEKEDGIEVLGIVTKKTVYNTILWSIILGLIAILGLVFYKYKSSHDITKETKLRLTDVEADFDATKKKNLLNEQVLRRKLQDEINKNRNI